MCTVSVIYRPYEHVVRLAVNRDEQRARAIALPPRVVRLGERLAVMPIDPTGGGTWVGVNDAGVVATILNVNRNDRRFKPSVGRWSRGLIIPALLHCSSAAEATLVAASLPGESFAPFRLLVLDHDYAAVVTGNGRRNVSIDAGSFPQAPLMLTSSGLGDDKVEPVRRAIFDRLVDREYPTPIQQDTFHQHRWRDRPELSVNMARAAAMTVSHTVVEMGPAQVALRYQPNGPRSFGGLRHVALDRSIVQVCA